MFPFPAHISNIMLRTSWKENASFWILITLAISHLRHHLGVTTDIEMGALLQQLPDLGPGLPEAVGHVPLLRLVPAEGGEQGQHAVTFPLLELALVNVVFALVPAAEVEKGGTNWLALCLLPSSLL